MEKDINKPIIHKENLQFYIRNLLTKAILESYLRVNKINQM